MNKSLISLLFVGTLAACGGGGDNAGNHDNPSAPNASIGGQNQQNGQNSGVKARLDACPFTITSVSGVTSCLAGSYNGTDTRTQESCSIRIEPAGAIKAQRGNTLSIQTSNPTSVDYAKIRLGSTGNNGNSADNGNNSSNTAAYLLNWTAKRTVGGTISNDARLSYNEKGNDLLLIEVFYKNTTTGSTGSVSCHIPH